MSDVALGLLAEIERLRKELDYLNNQRRLDNGDLARAYDEGRDNERAATVAWLRERDRYTQDDGVENAVSVTYWHAANIIERGQHRREEKP